LKISFQLREKGPRRIGIVAATTKTMVAVVVVPYWCHCHADVLFRTLGFEKKSE
jgi:hypothetical protein